MVTALLGIESINKLAKLNFSNFAILTKFAKVKFIKKLVWIHIKVLFSRLHQFLPMSTRINRNDETVIIIHICTHLCTKQSDIWHIFQALLCWLVQFPLWSSWHVSKQKSSVITNFYQCQITFGNVRTNLILCWHMSEHFSVLVSCSVHTYIHHTDV